MKQKWITPPQYKIVPRMTGFWIWRRKVYDLYRVGLTTYWSDPSFGNGGGDWSPQKEVEEKIETFKTFAEADTFKNELLLC